MIRTTDQFGREAQTTMNEMIVIGYTDLACGNAGAILYHNSSNKVGEDLDNLYFDEATKDLTVGGKILSAGGTLSDLLSFTGTTHAGLRLNNLTDAQETAIATPLAGMLLWNTTDSEVHVYDGATWVDIGTLAGNHTMLSATHTDSVADTVVRGDVLIGNSTPKWARLPVGGAGEVLTSDGTDVSWAAPGAISIGTAIGSGTAGSVLFVDASVQLAQDNANLFWDDTSDLLGIGINSPVTKLHIYEDTSSVGATAGLTIEQDGVGDAIAQFLLTGGQRWVVGIDNSDSDTFKIASSADLNSDAEVTLTSAGLLTTTGGITMSSGQLYLPAGVVATPSILFNTGVAGLLKVGIYSRAAGYGTLAAGSVSVADWNATEGLTAYVSLNVGSGGAISGKMMAEESGVVSFRMDGIENRIKIYSNYADASNHERLSVAKQLGSDILFITEKGVTTGELRNFLFEGDGVFLQVPIKSDANDPVHRIPQDPTFTGAGLDDMIARGKYTGSSSLDYRVKIDAEGTPDTFTWSDDGGSTWDAAGVSITSGLINLNNGVQLMFGATTGHTLDEYWDFTVTATGGIYYNSNGNKFRICQNETWYDLNPMAIGLDVSNGVSGAVLYVSSTGKLAQESASFNYNASTNALTLGGMLLMGGVTSSFPALKRSTTELHVRLADDSDYARIEFAGSTSSGLMDFTGTGHAGLRLNNLTDAQESAIGSPVAGMLIWNTTDTELHVYDGSSWTGVAGAGGSHATLSATHSDTLAAGVSRGSIIIGNSTPLWSELVVGSAGYVLTSDGTDVAWAAASAGMSIGGTVTSGTTGSVLFVGAGPVLAQDNANLFWDDSSDFLGIGTSSPATPLHLEGGTGDIITFEATGVTGMGRIWRATSNLSLTFNIDSGLDLDDDAFTGSRFMVSYDFQWITYSAGAGARSPNVTMVLKATTGYLGVGTSAPAAQLDVVGAIDTQILVSDNKSAATDKYGTVALLHYDVAEESISLIRGVSSNGANEVMIGGGTSNLNSATKIGFWIGASATTTTGAERLFLDESGLELSDGSSNGEMSIHVLRNQTSNATPTELFLDGSSSRVTIPSDSTWMFCVMVVGRRSDSDDESAGYEFKGIIDNNGGTTALAGWGVQKAAWEDQAAWDCAVDANDTNDAIRIQVTGEAGKTINWVATVILTKITA